VNRIGSLRGKINLPKSSPFAKLINERVINSEEPQFTYVRGLQSDFFA
jgi:hypothetical protein